MSAIDDLARLYSGAVSPDLAAQLAEEEQNAGMVGRQAFGEVGAAGAGSDLLDYLSRLHFSGQTQRANDLAIQSGIPQEQWTAYVNQRNAETAKQAPGLIRAVGRVGNTVADNPALLLAAPLALGAIGGAFGGAGAAAGGGGAATTYPLAAASGPVSAAPLAGGGAATAGALAPGGSVLAPITAGTGAIAPSISAGASAAAGAASMPNWLNWANLGSTALGLYGADRAADAQVGASDAAIAESRRQFDTARSDLAPSIELGGTAATLLRRYLAGDQSVYTQSPGYADEIAEGQKAIDRSASFRGRVLSGPSVREGIRYATSLTNRDQGQFVDRLLAAAGLGVTGASSSANAGANSAAQVGNATMNAGAARASGYANQYDALQGGVQNALLKKYLRL